MCVAGGGEEERVRREELSGNVCLTVCLCRSVCLSEERGESRTTARCVSVITTKLLELTEQSGSDCIVITNIFFDFITTFRP